MRVLKRSFGLQFEIKNRKANFMYLNGHSFFKIKMKKKNKIEVTSISF